MYLKNAQKAVSNITWNCFRFVSLKRLLKSERHRKKKELQFIFFLFSFHNEIMIATIANTSCRCNNSVICRRSQIEWEMRMSIRSNGEPFTAFPFASLLIWAWGNRQHFGFCLWSGWIFFFSLFLKNGIVRPFVYAFICAR